MKNLIFTLLIFSVAAAHAQKEANPGAAVPGAPAAPTPPQQNKYSPEIVQTIKNLSILLDRGAEIPPAKLDALAPELTAFNEKVKNALGKELLSEIAAREKALEDKARSESGKNTLQSFRGALQVYYGSKGGAYPKDPALLIPDELDEVPELYLPGHGRTAKITVIDSKKYDKDFSKAVTDSGGWLYFSNPGSANYGLLILDCTHSESGEAEFFRY